jgi:hypothetical protein
LHLITSGSAIGGEIATRPENRTKPYCADEIGAFFVTGDRTVGTQPIRVDVVAMVEAQGA